MNTSFYELPFWTNTWLWKFEAKQYHDVRSILSKEANVASGDGFPNNILLCNCVFLSLEWVWHLKM